jgi:hydroxyacylglutathione hydrolase
MKTVQFRYGDNLGYLITGAKSAMAVDGGAVDEMLQYLEASGLELAFVTNTHSHGDHTCGNEGLLSATSAELIPVENLPGMKKVMLEGNPVSIIHTPGHTEDSVCLYHGGDLLTGDTLFNGKIGRCFTGDTRAFYDSIMKILGFPEGTNIYAGHDYLLEYLDKAERLEPENDLIQVYREGYRPGELLTATLGWEKKVDPFLRFNRKTIIELLRNRGLPCETEYERFASMLTLM